MNATELHSIVKDVPMEALPECVTGWIRGLYVEVRANPDDGRPHAIHAQMFPDDAELLFIGSMAKWLETREQDSAVKITNHHGSSVVILTATWPANGTRKRYWDERVFEESTLIEALASACKAVVGKGATE